METIFLTDGLSVTAEKGPYENLILTFDFDRPEAKGKIVVETGSYGLYILAPECQREAIALVDLFYNSENGKDIEDNVPVQIVLYSPQVVDDAMGRVRYLPTHAYVEFEQGVVNLNDGHRLHEIQFGYDPEEFDDTDDW